MVIGFPASLLNIGLFDKVDIGDFEMMHDAVENKFQVLMWRSSSLWIVICHFSSGFHFFHRFRSLKFHIMVSVLTFLCKYGLGHTIVTVERSSESNCSASRLFSLRRIVRWQNPNGLSFFVSTLKKRDVPLAGSSVTKEKVRSC